MRIALYYPWIYLTSGVERTLLELSCRSRHEWTLYTSHFEPEHTYAGLSRCNVVNIGSVSVSRDFKSVSKAAWEISRLRLPMDRHDMLVVASEGLGDFVVFRNASKPVLCLCFTPLRVVFDSAYRERARGERGALGRLLLDAGSRVFRAFDRMAWKKYSRVICISGEACNRAIAGELAERHAIDILYPAPGFEAEKPSERFDRYFFLPGRIMWTKNLELGIHAFREFKSRGPECENFRLVIAGIIDKKSEPYYARLREMTAGDASIEFRVHPSDRELAELYRNCYGVLFTAFNEDWGLVPIEGMGFGKPVIAVNRGGPRESIEHGVQGYLEEPVASAFADHMVALARDPELGRRLGQAGFARAGQYTWKNFVDRMDDEIDRLCGAGHKVDWVPQAKAATQAAG